MTNLKKLGYKYPQADIPEFIELLKNGFYKSVDFLSKQFCTGFIIDLNNLFSSESDETSETEEPVDTSVEYVVVVDSIDENGWCADNAAVYFKKFKTKKGAVSD